MQMSAARAANGPARPHLTSRDRREGTRVRDHEDLGYREAAQAHTPCLGTIAKRLGLLKLLDSAWDVLAVYTELCRYTCMDARNHGDNS